jgi:hypothetical protein
LLKGFGVRRISAIHLGLAALAAFTAPCWPLEAANVLTFHNDNNRMKSSGDNSKYIERQSQYIRQTLFGFS